MHKHNSCFLVCVTTAYEDIFRDDTINHEPNSAVRVHEVITLKEIEPH